MRARIGEERLRHPEDHRVEIDDERGEDLGPAAREPEPLHHGLESGPDHALQRRDRGDDHEGGQGRAVGDGVDEVGAGWPDGRDQQATDRGADHAGSLGSRLVESDRHGQAFAGDEPRNGRGACRLVDGGDGRGQECHPVDQHDRGVRNDGEYRERGAGQRQDRLRQEQQPAAVDGVGDRAAVQREGDQRHQLDHRERTDRQGRAGRQPQLVGQRDDRDLAAGRTHHLAQPDQAEVAIPAQWLQVEQQGWRAAHARVRRRPMRCVRRTRLRCRCRPVPCGPARGRRVRGATLAGRGVPRLRGLGGAGEDPQEVGEPVEVRHGPLAGEPLSLEPDDTALRPADDGTGKLDRRGYAALAGDHELRRHGDARLEVGQRRLDARHHRLGHAGDAILAGDPSPPGSWRAPRRPRTARAGT